MNKLGLTLAAAAIVGLSSIYIPIGTASHVQAQESCPTWEGNLPQVVEELGREGISVLSLHFDAEQTQIFSRSLNLGFPQGATIGWMILSPAPHVVQAFYYYPNGCILPSDQARLTALDALIEVFEKVFGSSLESQWVLHEAGRGA